MLSNRIIVESLSTLVQQPAWQHGSMLPVHHLPVVLPCQGSTGCHLVWVTDRHSWFDIVPLLCAATWSAGVLWWVRRQGSAHWS
jgi:hypothetical protein